MSRIVMVRLTCNRHKTIDLINVLGNIVGEYTVTMYEAETATIYP
jgi:hypothetical protein